MEFNGIEEPKLSFKEVDRKYSEFKRLHENGIITEKEFDEQLKRWMVKDEQGRWWSKSLKSGAWHYYNGTAWVKGVPPGGDQTTPPTTPPTEGRRSDDQPQGERQEAWWRQKEVIVPIAVVFAGATWLVLAYVLSVPLVGGGVALLRATADATGWPLAFFALILMWVGTLVGLLGLRMRQGAHYRRLATTGLVAIFAGIAYLLLHFPFRILAGDPSQALVNSLIVMWLGFILTGVAYIRAGMLPPYWGRRALITLIIGTILSNVLYPLVGGLRGGPLVGVADVEAVIVSVIVGCIWLVLGYMLWSQRSAATPQR